MDDPYGQRGLAEIYDAACLGRPDFPSCRDLAKGAETILDIGCGTGEFLADLGRPPGTCVGLDPAGAMLDIARARPARLGRSFDLVLISGHAFQCSLGAADRPGWRWQSGSATGTARRLT